MVDKKGKSLRSLNIERIWPTLSPKCLSYLEIQQDPYFPYLPKDTIIKGIHTSIALGQEAAQHQPEHTNYRNILNYLLKEGLKIRFRKQHPTHPQVRAQYIHQPPTIDIFLNSIQQIQSFFQQTITKVNEEDLICLHLYHELFHYLEKRHKKKFQKKIAKCTIKQWGPIAIKKSLRSFHEIAAHAFTQAMMKLNWSPLLLDRLITYTQQGWTNEQIREQFAKVKEAVKELETLAK